MQAQPYTAWTRAKDGSSRHGAVGIGERLLRTARAHQLVGDVAAVCQRIEFAGRRINARDSSKRPIAEQSQPRWS